MSLDIKILTLAPSHGMYPGAHLMEPQNALPGTLDNN